MAAIHLLLPEAMHLHHREDILLLEATPLLLPQVILLLLLATLLLLLLFLPVLASLESYALLSKKEEMYPETRQCSSSIHSSK